MWKRILALALLCCVLCGCMSAEERQTAKSIVRAERTNFIAQARAQYGEKVKVRKIKAESHAVWNYLWPVIDHYSFSGCLEGTVIQPDGTEFKACYSPENHKVYSYKNHDAIRESVRDFPGLDRFDYEEIWLDQTYHGDLSYLPDDVLTFADMLDRHYIVWAYLFTTDDITGLTEEDFADLFRAWEQYAGSSSGALVLIQLKAPPDPEDPRPFPRSLSDMNFESENLRNTERDRETGEKVDIFDKYGIAASLYMGCTWSSNPRSLWKRFTYKYPPGVGSAAQDAQEEGPAPAGGEPVPE